MSRSFIVAADIERVSHLGRHSPTIPYLLGYLVIHPGGADLTSIRDSSKTLFSFDLIPLKIYVPSLIIYSIFEDYEIHFMSMVPSPAGD